MSQLPGRRVGYAAAACAFLHAAVSFYWGAGGTVGLDTVGRRAVELADSGGGWAMGALWFVGALKVAGGLLALALVQPWGRRFPHRLLLVAGGGGSIVLTLYGGANLGAALLVKAGAFAVPADDPADMDWRGFYGHLFLWSPWFLIWGLLLGFTTLCFLRGPRTADAPIARR